MVQAGVHIADVAIIQENCSDREGQAFTSVYLPDRVIPMLPAPTFQRDLQPKPGSVRLAISVFMELRRQESCSTLIFVLVSSVLMNA